MRFLFLLILLFNGLIQLAAQQETVIFFDDFENGDLGSAWTARPNLNGSNGFVGVQNGFGLNNSFALSISKTVNNTGEFTTNAADLSVDLSGQSSVFLEFSIVDLNEEDQPDDGLYLSDNGGATFVSVLRFYGSEWCNNLYGSFPPIDISALAAANGLSLNNNFVIRWQQRGLNSPFNTGNPDGFRLDNVRLVSRPIEYASIDFFADFNNNSLGSNAWAWRFGEQTTAINLPTQVTSPIGAVGVGLTNGIDGTPGIFMGRNCSGPVTTNALDLHLNLEGETDVALAFWIFDNNDLTHIDDGLYFSDDGGSTFIKAWDFLPDDWCDGFYDYHPPIDVDKIAAQLGLSMTSQFIIRFQQSGGEQFSNTGNPGGFLLDDVAVFRKNIEYAILPFEDDFDNGTAKPAWAWNTAEQTADLNLPNSPTGPNNSFGVGINNGINNTPGVFMGRNCAGPITTNAFDLHLNLAAHDQVFLDFDFFDNNDLTHTTDGLYFSDDGGESFTKVFDFVPNEYCDGIYGPFPSVDVDELAAQHNLTLSDEFIIRFQQSDSRPFVNSGDLAGFYLDNVRVNAAPIVYAPVPFFDNFNDQNFMPGWRLGNPANSVSIDLDNAVRGANNIVGIGELSGINGTPGIFMGRNCAGPLTANALDLYVNLAFQTNATLDFWLFDNGDLTHVDDGIYFSNDGGQNFQKAVDFDPNAWQDGTYFMHPTVFINEIAEELGMSLSANFVIRFQQIDTRPFVNSGDLAGFLIDDVNIGGLPSSTNEVAALNKQVKIIPNPAADRIQLDRSIATDTPYRLFGLAGNELQQGRWSGSLDVSDLQAGVYVLQFPLLDGNKPLALRFVKR